MVVSLVFSGLAVVVTTGRGLGARGIESFLLDSLEFSIIGLAILGPGEHVTGEWWAS